jgi:hypothetical protein
VKTRLTYKGPSVLYFSYFVVFALSLCLVGLSFKLDSESALFRQLLATGIGVAVISLALILYYTQLERKIIPHQWRKELDGYYNDEGVFEYTHDGFSLIAHDGKSLDFQWREIIRAESGESQINRHIKKFHIDLFLSERDFITVDSTMSGFSVFEKRLKENLRDLLKKEAAYVHEDHTTAFGQPAAKIS